MPPEHTLIIEGNITSSISNTTQQRIDRHLRHRIITTCGDANVMMGSKHIDPALCIYIKCFSTPHKRQNWIYRNLLSLIVQLI